MSLGIGRVRVRGERRERVGENGGKGSSEGKAMIRSLRGVVL